MAAAYQEELGRGPMAEINTTPLIDVMLVLLIMFIITIPIQTHSVEIDLPSGPPGLVDRTKNKVVIEADGTILWNGTQVSRAQLAHYLELTKRIAPAPELHLQPDASARYAEVDAVLAIIKRSEVTAMGFVGNEAYARF